jgi:hypothetical protein
VTLKIGVKFILNFTQLYVNMYASAAHTFQSFGSNINRKLSSSSSEEILSSELLDSSLKDPSE